MTNKTNHITEMRILLGLSAIAALCIALPVRAALPYATASNASELSDDIYYANSGGTNTNYLQPNTSFTNLLGLEWGIDDYQLGDVNQHRCQRRPEQFHHRRSVLGPDVLPNEVLEAM